MPARKKKLEDMNVDSPPGERTLRENAEEQLARVPKYSAVLKGKTPEQLVHELQVNQIELETQAEELKRSHLALAESRDKFLDLYDFAPTGYLTLTDQVLIAEVNLSGATLLGVERSKLVNTRFRKFIAPEDFELWDKYFANVLDLGEKQTCTLMLKQSDGSVFPARLEGFCIHGSDGAMIVRIAISDISDIWQIKALRASEEKYRRLFETAQEGILILDEETGKIIDANTFLLDLLGYPLEYFIGRHLWELGFIKDKSIAQHAFTELKTNRYVRYEDLPLETKDGQSIDVEFISNVYLVGDTKIIQCNIRDITARKRTEDALALTSRKLNLLSSITRHDINNQLLTLNGFLGILQTKVPDSTLEDYFKKITKASERIAAMILFTKEYEKIGVNAPIWQDCRTLVDTAAKQAQLRRVCVKNDLPDGTEVFADPLIVKVFYNLIDNAMRYGGKITTIRIAAEEHNADYIMVCEDDGDGILADEKERIFDRGFGKNTGLGLTLSREILAITGITISETGEPGKGARFEISVSKDMWRIGKANRKLDFKDATEKELHEKPNPAPVP